MTPQLLVPNPKNTRLLYCKSGVKIRFLIYSGWCTDGAFRVATIIGGSKSVTKGMTPQLLVPNPKNTRFNIASQELKFDFGFIPAGAQMRLLE
nr:unnamed protein product [Callosobruchus analis]